MNFYSVKKLNSLIILLIIFLFLYSLAPKQIRTNNATAINLNDTLQQTAVEALGKREGTIIVIDPQTGSVLALVNKELAFEKSLSPGSTIKPFTALTALRSGVIKEDSTLVCRAPYKHDGFQIGCVHQKESAPFDLVHALAHSCNYFFGKLGERINKNKFNNTLSLFGFEEETGKLPREKWQSRIAIGETEELLVTPYNLINAYIALVNDGKLFKQNSTSFRSGLMPAKRDNDSTRAGSSSSPLNGTMMSYLSPPRFTKVEINVAHRSLIIEGMRGAVEYGTAEKANLDELPLNIFGKTGTATGEGNYKMQGWFVGFAADAETKGRVPNPEEIKLAVLVFIKGAHGSDCAQASKQIFTTFQSLQVPSLKSQVPSQEKTADGGRRTAGVVQIKIGKENSVKEMSLEEYVLGVLVGESSIENEIEALKAQAVATRTYAMKHLQRHAKEGYDFCTLTHCQRFEPVSFSSVNQNLRRAVEETKGQVLNDSNGRLIEAYFSASCGGMTANLRDLWGVQSKPYLKTVRDDFCTVMPHNEWEAVISKENLAKALQGDKRSNVGNRLNQIRIIKRDSSGRAEILLLSGERGKQVRGWDFKIIVGRALGWNLIKSSRFNVRRVGNDFIFTGSGFGHGLGLCQEGAHVMAERGYNYQQILARYFPATRIGTL